MACNLAPQCKFLYGHFQFDIPEDTIDVEITVQTLKGIHNFRKDHTTQQKFTCSPWGSQVKPFPSLRKKMRDYMEERQNSLNPFLPTQIYPNRLNPSPFVKLCKANPKRKRTVKAAPKKVK